MTVRVRVQPSALMTVQARTQHPALPLRPRARGPTLRTRASPGGQLRSAVAAASVPAACARSASGTAPPRLALRAPGCAVCSPVLSAGVHSLTLRTASAGPLHCTIVLNGTCDDVSCCTSCTCCCGYCHGSCGPQPIHPGSIELVRPVQAKRRVLCWDNTRLTRSRVHHSPATGRCPTRGRAGVTRAPRRPSTSTCGPETAFRRRSLAATSAPKSGCVAMLWPRLRTAGGAAACQSDQASAAHWRFEFSPRFDSLLACTTGRLRERDKHA